LNRTLAAFLAQVTERVISEGIAADSSEVEVRPVSSALPGPTENVAGSDLVQD
jgi:hypothetical protein